MECDGCMMGAAVTVRHPLPVSDLVSAPITARFTPDTREILLQSPSLMRVSARRSPLNPQVRLSAPFNWGYVAAPRHINP